MIHRTLCLALSTALMATTVFASQEPAAAPSAATPRPAAPELSGELVRLFPDRTAAYVEVAHVASVIGLLGPEPLLELANAILGKAAQADVPEGAKPAPALTMREFNTLLDASAAAGIIPPKGDTTPALETFSPERAVVVLRMSSADGLALLRTRVLARLPGATVEKVRGEKLVRKAIEEGMSACEAFATFGIM